MCILKLSIRAFKCATVLKLVKDCRNYKHLNIFYEIIVLDFTISLFWQHNHNTLLKYKVLLCFIKVLLRF